MKILGIDPGPKYSAYTIWNTGSQKIYEMSGDKTKTGESPLRNKIDNDDLLMSIDRASQYIDCMGIEMIESFGMPVGAETFETCVWIGRFYQAAVGRVILIKRGAIKMHFCNTRKAKDGNIRQALIDRFGPPGTQKNKGITYGLAADLWQAFAVAVYVGDMGVST